MKNDFYFTLKALFVLKTLTLSSWLSWPCIKTAWLENKVNLKIYDVTTRLRNNDNTHIAHILPNISRTKDNQTMKFGQLIEYNMRNIFVEISYTKCGR